MEITFIGFFGLIGANRLRLRKTIGVLIEFFLAFRLVWSKSWIAMLMEIDETVQLHEFDLVTIESVDMSSPSFILLHFISKAMKVNAKVIFIMTVGNDIDFRFVA